jgi:chromosome segregation ATPase
MNEIINKLREELQTERTQRASLEATVKKLQEELKDKEALIEKTKDAYAGSQAACARHLRDGEALKNAVNELTAAIRNYVLDASEKMRQAGIEMPDLSKVLERILPSL